MLLLWKKKTGFGGSKDNERMFFLNSIGRFFIVSHVKSKLETNQMSRMINLIIQSCGIKNEEKIIV